jgi:hypothetical protein
MDTTTTFSTAHIGLTAAVCGVLALPVTTRLCRSTSRIDKAAVALVAAVATFTYRLAANMPQLNRDGVPGFSANDLLAPAMTYVLLGLYASVRPPEDPARFAVARALITGVALVVNVVTI